MSGRKTPEVDTVLLSLLRSYVGFLIPCYQRGWPHKIFYSVKQGNKRVTEYIIEFHIIAAESHWNGEALTDAFFQGLNETIKNELATQLL